MICTNTNHERFRGVFDAVNGCLACQCEEEARLKRQWQSRAEEYEKQLIEIVNFMGKDATDESGNSIAEVAIAEMKRLKRATY